MYTAKHDIANRLIILLLHFHLSNVRSRHNDDAITNGLSYRSIRRAVPVKRRPNAVMKVMKKIMAA
jgi:hypothetical protein